MGKHWEEHGENWDLASFQEKYCLLIKKVQTFKLFFYQSIPRRLHLEIEGDTPLPRLIRKYSETSECVQAPKELSYVGSLVITDTVWLVHYRRLVLFLNEYFEIKDICSKMSFFWGSGGYFNLCLIKLFFQKDSNASKELVFFPTLWAKVKMSWKQIDTGDFLKVTGHFRALCSALSFHLHLISIYNWYTELVFLTVNHSSSKNIPFTLRKLKDILVKSS